MQGLLVQCPHCLHLVRLGNGVLNNNTVCFECTSCHSNIALPYQNDTHAPNTQKAHPHPIALHEDTVLPEIPESHLRALETEDEKAAQSPQHPLPDALVHQIAAIDPDRPGSTGIKNACSRLWEEQWDDRSAHESFIQKANHQNALPVAGQLYGAVLRKFPEDKKARFGQEKILNLGLLQLGHMRGTTNTSPRKISTKTALWGIGLIIGNTMLTFIFSTLSRVVNNTPGLAN